MKRWVNTITICILIGAIINVAIAWWFAIRLDPYAPTINNRLGISYEGSGSGEWLVDTTIWNGSTITVSQFFGNNIFEEQETTAIEANPYWANLLRPRPNKDQPYWPQIQYAVAHGWPLRSMMRLVGAKFNESDKYIVGLQWSAPTWLRGMQTAPLLSLDKPILLPLKIIWPGLIANTLLYSIVPFLIFILKFKLRGFLRFKRKQCTECGYPIGQSQVCTECGAQLKAYT